MRRDGFYLNLENDGLDKNRSAARTASPFYKGRRTEGVEGFYYAGTGSPRCSGAEYVIGAVCLSSKFTIS